MNEPITSVVWSVVMRRSGAKIRDSDGARRRRRTGGLAILQLALPREPHGTFGHVSADPECEEGRHRRDPQQRPPRRVGQLAQQRVGEFKGGGGEQGNPNTKPPSIMPEARPRKSRRPVFEHQRHAGRPHAAHAESEQRTQREEHRVGRRGNR